MPKRALLIINPQKGYFEATGGISNPRQVLRIIKSVKSSDFFNIIYITRDTRLLNDIAFSNCTPGKKRGDVFHLSADKSMTIESKRCVYGSQGHQIHPHLPYNTKDIIVDINTNPTEQTYSLFRDSGKKAWLTRNLGKGYTLKERQRQRRQITNRFNEKINKQQQ